MEYTLIDTNNCKYMIENEVDILNEEKSEEFIQSSFIAENEMPEVQKNENRNESQNNLESFKEYDYYKMFDFNFLNNNNNENINFLSRKKNRTKMGINNEKNVEQRYCKNIKQRTNENFFKNENDIYKTNYFQIFNFNIKTNTNKIGSGQFLENNFEEINIDENFDFFENVKYRETPIKELCISNMPCKNFVNY